MPRLTHPVLDHLLEVARASEGIDNEATDASRAPPAVASVAGRFQLGPRLGEGGMGSVYRAHDRADGRAVAVKILHHADDPKADRRFDREGRALADLEHPGIVRYVAHGGGDGAPPFVAMELVEGESLAAQLRHGPLPMAIALRVGIELGHALAAVHAHGLVHRDVKPANVVVTEDGSLKLVDFGLARAERDDDPLTSEGLAAGTWGYMAPEQARGDRELDGRADLFSLGCLIFHCVAGRAPFRGPLDVLEPAPRLRSLVPTTPELVDALVSEMLQPNRALRPRGAGEVATTLAAIARWPGFDVLRAPMRGSFPCLGRPTPFVGRAADLAWLREQIASNQRPLVIGGAGLGKTRFVAMAADGDPDDTWTWVKADLLSRDAPFSFLATLLQRVAGARAGARREVVERTVLEHVRGVAAEPVALELARFAVAPLSARPESLPRALASWALGDWSRARRSLVLDDLGSADTWSLELLASLLARAGSRAPRVVGIARPDFVRRLPSSVAELGFTLLRLGALSTSNVDDLARELGGDADLRLDGARASGAALHVEETLRSEAFRAPLPSEDTLEARIDAKHRALGPYARWALRGAAALGDTFHETDLVELLGQRDPEAARRALGELALTEIVETVDARARVFRFRHNLDREAALDATSPSDRAFGARFRAVR